MVLWYGIEVNGKPPFRELIRQLRFGITLFNLSLRRSKATVATLGRVAATRKGSRKDVVVYTPRKTTLPGVCSSVEAGEVARVAWRRGGDLPRGLRFAQNDRYSKYE